MKIVWKNAFLVHEQELVNLVAEGGAVRRADTIDLETADHIEDLEGRLVLRGFADTHLHLDKALIGEKVINKSGTLYEAIQIMSKYKPTMSEEDIEQRMRQVIEWAHANGTRFMRTNIDIDENIQLRSLNVFQKLQREYQGTMILESVAFPQEGFLQDNQNYAFLEQALQAGANVLGGIPAFDHDPLLHLKKMMDLAKRYDVDVDAHIDETDDPTSLTLRDLARLTKEYGYEGRVTAAHCCSLAANDPEVVDAILQEVHDAQMTIVPLPSTNLYLQGREDKKNVRRGIAPIKKMVHDFTINVAIGSDNVRDPFNCFGNANPLQSALIAAHGAQMGGTQDFDALFAAISINGMKLMHYDPAVEGSEFFIVVDAHSAREAIIGVSPLYGTYEAGVFSKA